MISYPLDYLYGQHYEAVLNYSSRVPFSFYPDPILSDIFDSNARKPTPPNDFATPKPITHQEQQKKVSLASSSGKVEHGVNLGASKPNLAFLRGHGRCWTGFSSWKWRYSTLLSIL